MAKFAFSLVIIVEIIIMEISYGRIFDVLDHLLSKHNRHINLKITTDFPIANLACLFSKMHKLWGTMLLDKTSVF